MTRMLVLACAALLACDRPAIRGDRASGDSPALAVDTPTGSADAMARAPSSMAGVARGERQPARAPSAIQRVTGRIEARGAGRALDSLLAVRVLDARGREVAGVPVRWHGAAAGGAALRVIRGTTDRVGLSVAAFTPGRAAHPQEVVAEVAGVGRITFTVTVPAASARVAPDRIVLWSGDDTVVAATLADPSGAGLVTSVRFVTLDGGAAPAMRVSVRSEGVRAELPATGMTHTARVVMDPDAPAFIHASPLDAASGVHQVILRVDDHRTLRQLLVALVPTAFTITRGSHAGQVIPIDAERAMRRAGGSAAFWRLVPLSGTGARKLLGWRETAYPLRLAFSHADSREIVSGADSAAFWQIARDMERDLGRDLFTPADMRDTAAHAVIRIEVRPHSAEGHTFVSWAQAGDATDAVLLFARAATLRAPRIVTHELAHVLGFGHTFAWPSIARPREGGATRLTPSDVAHIQLAMRLRALQETTGALPGLPVPAPPPVRR